MPNDAMSGRAMLGDIAISPVDPDLGGRIRHAIDVKTKPPGSLGRIEGLAHQIALAQNREDPSIDPPHLLLFAGDHGIVAEGVSAWPQEVTAQMVLNFLGGGAAANVFAKTTGCGITVADAGVASALPDDPGLVRAGIRQGTRNALNEDALTADEVAAALRFGADLAIARVEAGARAIAIGEMGIGNTASAALVSHALTGIDLTALTGPGAGLATEGVSRKAEILGRAAARRPGRLAATDALTAFGGLEIAAMAGAAIGAASHRVPVVVDGFIATAAALAALTARPEVRPYIVFSHRSEEPGHRLVLEALDASPLLDLDLRLGEGTGALLALPLLRAACAMLTDMATFESAGVSDKA